MMPEKVLNSFRDRFFFNGCLDLVNLSKIERPQNAVENGRDFSNDKSIRSIAVQENGKMEYQIHRVLMESIPLVRSP